MTTTNKQIDDNRPVLVLGATGKTGSRIVQRLRERAVPVRIGSRSAPTAFDWTQPQGWDAALQGTGALYLSYYPDLAVPGAPEQVDALVQRALAHGVRRIVLLSGRGEEEAQRAERVLQASAADWTILRCSWFMQNFDEGLFQQALQGGELALPVGDVGEPFVDADDIADVAVAAFTDPRHVGQLYELTGPEALSFAQAVQHIADASGRDLEYRQVPMQQYRQQATAAGIPEDVVGFLEYLFGEVLDGRNSASADGVQRALGRPPRAFRQWAASAYAPPSV